MENVNKHFLSYFAQSVDDFTDTINAKEPKELVLMNQEYLLPYLRFIRGNKNVYGAAFRNPNGMQVNIQ